MKRLYRKVNKNTTQKRALTKTKGIQGLTIIESLITLSILSITFAGLSTAIIGLSKANNENHHRREAVRAATQVLESYRLTPISELKPNEVSEEIVTFTNTDYLVSSYFCEEAKYCADNQLLHIRLVVSLNDKELYSTETVFLEFDN